MACGGQLYLTLKCKGCGEARRVVVSCGDRACPDCRKREYNRLKRVYAPKMALLDTRKLVFFTLTRRIRAGARLAAQVKSTKKALSKLMRLASMRAVRGGLYSLEIKWSAKHAGWNVHVHAVAEVDGRVKVWKDRVSKRPKADVLTRLGNISIQTLRRDWARLTGDSDRVDITPVLESRGGVKGVMGYILKYLAKGTDLATKAQVDEYNKALKGQRLVHTFGTWHPRSRNYRFEGVVVPEVRLTCDCGCQSWLSEFELKRVDDELTREARMEHKYQHLLRRWGGVRPDRLKLIIWLKETVSHEDYVAECVFPD